MGEMVSFPSNGTQGEGYLAMPESGSGPGVIVIQEWWGLNDQIKSVAERLAGEGFVALAPDLYRGAHASEPDEAAKIMMSLNLERATKDLSGAVDYLAAHDAVTGDGLGVIGFCMGGGVALWLATLRPDQIKAAVPFYGIIPWEAAQPDFSKLAAAVQGHYAENDDFANPESVRALDAQLKGLGKQAEFFEYPGTDHAFTNDQRPEVFVPEATALAYDRAFAFLHEQLAS
ncbi:MAG: carboxymethylenebutenolidase [Actinomycetota bacterium]|jgi:carboxymethylenebutenolidase|nr:carboxymethylenebutenolidase [Actinomycetota bacterium]